MRKVGNQRVEVGVLRSPQPLARPTRQRDAKAMLLRESFGAEMYVKSSQSLYLRAAFPVWTISEHVQKTAGANGRDGVGPHRQRGLVAGFALVAIQCRRLAGPAS